MTETSGDGAGLSLLGVVGVQYVDPVLGAARAGDPAAFGELWRRHSAHVAGYLRVHGVPDADDVTSEVFLAAFRGIARFEGDAAAFRAWLFTIAHHRAVDVVRRRTRTPELQPYLPGCDERSVPSAEDAALRSLSDKETRTLLATLTDEQREVIVLRFVADLSVENCAEILGRSPDAVKKLQRRAIARLRRLLDTTDGAGVTALPVPESPGAAIAPTR